MVDLNDRGEVIGRAVENGLPRAFVWREGQVRDIRTEIGMASIGGVQTVDINERGQVALSAQIGSACPGGWNAVLWDPVDEPRMVCGRAGGVDESGRMAVNIAPAGPGSPELVIWDDGEMTEIPLPAGASIISIGGLTTQGEIFGSFNWSGCAPTAPGAALLQDGRFELVACYRFPTDFSSSGAYTAAEYFSASGGIVVRDGAVESFSDFTPQALNESGAVAGMKLQPGGEKVPMIWRDGFFEEIVVDDLDIVEVVGLNNRGQLLVNVRMVADPGFWHAYLLDPL